LSSPYIHDLLKLRLEIATIITDLLDAVLESLYLIVDDGDVWVTFRDHGGIPVKLVLFGK
jgi:hypothetical protein